MVGTLVLRSAHVCVYKPNLFLSLALSLSLSLRWMHNLHSTAAADHLVSGSPVPIPFSLTTHSLQRQQQSRLQRDLHSSRVAAYPWPYFILGFPQSDPTCLPAPAYKADNSIFLLTARPDECARRTLTQHTPFTVSIGRNASAAASCSHRTL